MSFLQNIFLLVRCYAYFLVRGRARTIENPKAVCVIQTAQMGDMVCTTPMFRAVKKMYPHCKVFIIGTAINKELLADNKDVDGYLAWSNDVSAMAEAIRAWGCDFGCTTSPDFKGLAALYLAGVPLIAVPRVVGGFCPTETKSYKLLRLLATAVPHDFYAYAPREYLRLLKPININVEDTKKYLAFSAEADTMVQKLLAEKEITGRFAVMAPGAGNKIKRWPPERFAQVADYIAQKYMPVVIVGGVADRGDTEALMSHARASTVHDLSRLLSVDQLKALIARAALFISVDTGPLYIAEAFDVPTIDIVGPVSEHDQPPNNPPRHVVVVPPRKKPAMFAFNGRIYDKTEVNRQARATKTEEVTDAVDGMVAVFNR